MDFNFEMSFCIPSTQIVPISNVLQFRVPLYVFPSIYMGYLKMSKKKAWPRCGGYKTLGKHERWWYISVAWRRWGAFHWTPAFSKAYGEPIQWNFQWNVYRFYWSVARPTIIWVLCSLGFLKDKFENNAALLRGHSKNKQTGTEWKVGDKVFDFIILFKYLLLLSFGAMYILRSQKIQIFDPLPPPVHILFTLRIPPWEITFASP